MLGIKSASHRKPTSCLIDALVRFARCRPLRGWGVRSSVLPQRKHREHLCPRVYDQKSQRVGPGFVVPYDKPPPPRKLTELLARPLRASRVRFGIAGLGEAPSPISARVAPLCGSARASGAKWWLGTRMATGGNQDLPNLGIVQFVVNSPSACKSLSPRSLRGLAYWLRVQQISNA